MKEITFNLSEVPLDETVFPWYLHARDMAGWWPETGMDDAKFVRLKAAVHNPRCAVGSLMRLVQIMGFTADAVEWQTFVDALDYCEQRVELPQPGAIDELEQQFSAAGVQTSRLRWNSGKVLVGPVE